MDLTFNQVIIDNDCGTIYYDGDSMGGGVIEFECLKCNSRINKETFYFFTGQKELQQYKQKLNDYFKIPKVKSIGDNSLAGLRQCNACE